MFFHISSVMNLIGKSLIFFGILLIGIGILVLFGSRIPWFGRLPGDIMIKKENFTFYFPLTTSILISVVISLILFLFTKR